MIYDITPITFNQLDLLSAGHPQGGLQQTGHIAAAGFDLHHVVQALDDGRLRVACGIQKALIRRWEDLPMGSFRESGTNINTGFLMIRNYR